MRHSVYPALLPEYVLPTEEAADEVTEGGLGPGDSRERGGYFTPVRQSGTATVETGNGQKEPRTGLDRSDANTGDNNSFGFHRFLQFKNLNGPYVKQVVTMMLWGWVVDPKKPPRCAKVAWHCKQVVTEVFKVRGTKAGKKETLLYTPAYKPGPPSKTAKKKKKKKTGTLTPDTDALHLDKQWAKVMKRDCPNICGLSAHIYGVLYDEVTAENVSPTVGYAHLSTKTEGNKTCVCVMPVQDNGIDHYFIGGTEVAKYDWWFLHIDCPCPKKREGKDPPTGPPKDPPRTPTTPPPGAPPTPPPPTTPPTTPPPTPPIPTPPTYPAPSDAVPHGHEFLKSSGRDGGGHLVGELDWGIAGQRATGVAGVFAPGDALPPSVRRPAGGE